MLAELLARLPIEPDATELARVRQARIYLWLLRPAILVVAAIVVILDVLVEPGALSRDSLISVGGFIATQPLFLLLLVRGMDPIRVIGTSFVLDSAFLWWSVVAAPTPATSACSYVIILAVVGYFFTARTTFTYALAAAVGIAVAGPRLDRWDDPAPFPAASSIIIVTGVLMALHSSRVRRSEEQLEQLVADQRESLERLEQVDRARDRLIANVSHELRTPLTATIGSIETMLRNDIDLDDATRMELLELARGGGHRLLALVEDLLALGATRPDAVHLEARDVRLAALAHDAVTGIVADDGRHIRVDVYDNPVVHVDRLRMIQVVSNLVVNAVHHGAGEITVESRAAADGVAEICVLDEGPGVEPQHIGELFLPFARFSSRTDSTGLGLAISRTIVEAHGGTLTYGRVDGRTCFTVHVPRAEARP